MNINILKHPIPHIVIDNFLDDINGISNLAKSLYGYSVVGAHGNEVFDGLKRREVYLETIPENKRIIVDHIADAFMTKFWSEEMKLMFSHLEHPFPMMNAVSDGGLLLGFYDSEDHYTVHHDNSFMTAVLYIHSPKKFTGGDFIITNQLKMNNYKEEERVIIESISNRLVIFPSCYLHGVTQILSQSKGDVDGMRIALSYFMSFHPFN